MITTEKLSRGVINARINRIRRVFNWAVSEELVPSSAHEGLRARAGLRYGRSAARETEPVLPVDDATVNETLPFLAPQIADMVMLQRVTSMRPGDVVIMRACDIQMNSRVWIYEPPSHKTKYRGLRRLIPIGPKGENILRRYLNRSTDAYLFTPQEAEDSRREQRRQQPRARKTKAFPCELRRLELEKQNRQRRKRKRPLGDRYNSESYYKAVQYGIAKARRAGVKVLDWFPNQLRHTRATEVRRTHGLEGAQVVLGHAHADVTQIYAERNMALATDIAEMTG